MGEKEREGRMTVNREIKRDKVRTGFFLPISSFQTNGQTITHPHPSCLAFLYKKNILTESNHRNEEKEEKNKIPPIQQLKEEPICSPLSQMVVLWTPFCNFDELLYYF